MDASEIRYRPNVAAIVRNRDGRILVAERWGVDDAWQFPQGGVDPGETHEQGLIRELEEELSLGIGDYVIREKKGPYRYLLGRGRTKKGFHGQEQHYFLVDLQAPETGIDVLTPHPEFQNYQWIRPEEFDLRWLPEMKRAVYCAVLRDFFGVELKWIDASG